MARWAYSIERCYRRRAGLLLPRIQGDQRREVIGGITTRAKDDWYRDWDQFAQLTTELMIRASHSSGSGHTGGTMVLTLRPIRRSAVAHEVLYWLRGVADGQVDAFAKRVEAFAPRGAMIASSLVELSASASRYLRLVPETVIPEYYPTHSSPLYGGDWRRVGYDVRELRRLVPVLSSRVCRSSVPLTARLGGPEHCFELLEHYLYSQIGERWRDSEVPAAMAGVPPGIDDAYGPFASAAYESCELTPQGTAVGYGERLRCLKRLLHVAPSGATRVGTDEFARKAGEYLKAECELEVAPELSLENPLARPMISEEECIAVGSVRARFLLDNWITAHADLRKHLQARDSWGRHIEQRLPTLQARLDKATRLTLEKARGLAREQCAGASRAAADLGAECSKTLERYWLSYAYVPGMRLEGDASQARQP